MALTIKVRRILARKPLYYEMDSDGSRSELPGYANTMPELDGTDMRPEPYGTSMRPAELRGFQRSPEMSIIATEKSKKV